MKYLAVIAVLASMATACEDSAGPPEDEPGDQYNNVDPAPVVDEQYGDTHIVQYENTRPAKLQYLPDTGGPQL